MIRYVSRCRNGLFYVPTADKDNENMCYWWCLSTEKVREPLISLASFDRGPSPHPLVLPATPLHAVTPSACTCQISLTSSAATPYDTPPYCPEPACHLALHVFMHLRVWKARVGVWVGVVNEREFPCRMIVCKMWVDLLICSQCLHHVATAFGFVPSTQKWQSVV